MADQSNDTVGKLLDGALNGIRQDIRDMRTEQREDLKTLTEKVDTGFFNLHAAQSKAADDLGEHEKKDLEAQAETNLRLTRIEDARKTSKWFVRTAVGTGLLFLSDLVVNHLPRWWK